MKILFISRAYPPVIGGIEKQNYELAKALSEYSEIQIIANPHGKKFLPLFFFIALFKAIFYKRTYDIILLGDAVLAPLGWLLKTSLSKPVISIIHGLDITYSSYIYQRIWVRAFLARLDAVFAVGNETIRQAISRGIDVKKCIFIPNGVSQTANQTLHSQATFNFIPNPEKKYLLTLGRLVERKGVAWFIEQIMPCLDSKVEYIVAGDGIERETIKAMIHKMGLKNRVHLLGHVTDEEKALLLQLSDLFIQPNIKVQNDMEGFGLVVLEAAAAGLPVIASKLEGLCDAIQQNENGILIDSLDADTYIRTINNLIYNQQLIDEFGEKAKNYVESHCLWTHIAKQYHAKLKQFL